MFSKLVNRKADFFKEKTFFFRIFTSQFGKKSSLDQIEKYLQDIRHVNTEFCQGNTMRWAIAWTFDGTFNFPKQISSRKVFLIEELNSQEYLLFVIENEEK